jgi:ABC-type molybdate transport system substrate-binding protein
VAFLTSAQAQSILRKYGFKDAPHQRT